MLATSDEAVDGKVWDEPFLKVRIPEVHQQPPLDETIEPRDEKLLVGGTVKPALKSASPKEESVITLLSGEHEYLGLD